MAINKVLPLDDAEQAFLYRVCQEHSERAYFLVRRLAISGLLPDPPYMDQLDIPTSHNSTVKHE